MLVALDPGLIIVDDLGAVVVVEAVVSLSLSLSCHPQPSPFLRLFRLESWSLVLMVKRPFLSVDLSVDCPLHTQLVFDVG